MIRASAKTLILALAIFAWVWITPTIRADDPKGLYGATQRFGVCVASAFAGYPDFPGQVSDYARAGELGFGWYSDWTIRQNPQQPEGIEYAQLLPTRSWPPTWSRVDQVLDANPGALWIIGNEPETRGQGQHTPEEYARIYHEAYTYLKARDPSCRVAIGGIVMPTPLRLEWLDRCLEAYRAEYGQALPVDIWNIHVQILQEERYGWGCGIPHGLDDDTGRRYEIIDNCDPVIFRELVVSFCQWLVDHDERDKPLIISEYGVLMPSSYLPAGDESVLRFMEGTFDFMLSARDPLLGYSADGYRLVQRWMWFSLNGAFFERTPGGYNGALCDWENPATLTIFGERHARYTNSLRQERVVLEPVADTSLDRWAPNESLGQAGRLYLRADHTGGEACVLLQFDLEAIPPNAIVSRGMLQLQVVDRSNPQPLHLRLLSASAPWDEATTAVPWEPIHGPSGQFATPLTLSDQDQVIELWLTDLVQGWVNGATPNEGLLMTPIGALNDGNVSYALAASEWVEGDQLRPRLTIDYLTRD